MPGGGVTYAYTPGKRAGGRLRGIAFLVVRGITALGAILYGFVLTYAFARTLEPKIFRLLHSRRQSRRGALAA